MVFSNLGDFNPGERLYALADLFIKDTLQKKTVEKKAARDSTTAILKDTLSLRKYVGSYIGDDGLPFSFEIKKRKLYYHIFGESNFLIKETKDSFSIPDAPEIKFAFAVKGKDTTCDLSTPDQLYHLRKYVKDTSQTDKILLAYMGTYYCPELGCKYEIVLKDHQLMLTNAKYNDTKLTLVNTNYLTNDNRWVNHLVMLRDAKNNITGFEVNSGRIMHLRFDKIK